MILITPLDLQKTNEAAEILQQHLYKWHPLAELSEAVGLSTYRLNKLFKHVFDRTVYQYEFELKMAEGLRLLMQMEEPVKNIASRVGYKKANHFTEAFERFYDCKPTDVKKIASVHLFPKRK